MQIRDSVFIVTGSASGLGAATARRLVQAGGQVLLSDLNENSISNLASELGSNASFCQTDVSDAASAESAVAACRSAFGTVHGLINCAGIAPSEKVVGRSGPHKLDSFARTVQVNLVGTFNMLRLVAASMAADDASEGDERGVIVNTASIAAFDGQIGQAGYAASKGGVVAMTLPIARELARARIRVMTVAPGIMETPMLKAMPTEVQDALGRMVPFPARMGQPEEFAALVAHIIENPYLNGEVIRLDGAIRMAAK